VIVLDIKNNSLATSENRNLTDPLIRTTLRDSLLTHTDRAFRTSNSQIVGVPIPAVSQRCRNTINISQMFLAERYSNIPRNENHPRSRFIQKPQSQSDNHRNNRTYRNNRPNSVPLHEHSVTEMLIFPEECA